MLLTAPTVCDAHCRPGTHQRFDTLLCDLLAGFLVAPGDRLDVEIATAIRRIVEYLHLDQGMLIQCTEDPGRFVLSHSWPVAARCPIPPASQPAAMPWVHHRLAAGNTLLFSSVDELPPEAEQDKAFFRSSGTRSLASLPLTLHEGAAGALVFISQSDEVLWPNDLVQRLERVAGILGCLLDQRRRSLDLEERLCQESLLAEVSARFINLPATQLDAAIEDTQRLLCEHLGLDRSALFQVSDEGPDVLLLTHLHQPADGPPVQRRPAPSPLASSYWVSTDATPPAHVRLDAKVLFPWVYEQLQHGQTVVIPELEDLPDEAAADKEMFRQYQTKSSVVVPLSIGGTWLGCLTFAATRQSRHWSEVQVRHFRFIADVFANALARRRVNQVLRENEERLELATESAGVGLWSMQTDTRQLWLTAKARDVLAFASDDDVTDERLFARIHPEDSALIRDAVRQALQGSSDLHTDCRIVLPDGSHRWIALRGRPQGDVGGELHRLMGVVVDITNRKRTETELHRTLEELQRLQEQLQRENLSLRKEAQIRRGAMPIVGCSDSLMKVIRQAEQVAATDSTVLLLGETGTGKELLAQYMHHVSRRSAKAFVTTNIAAIPATLLESELFGREKGAYTGALTKEIGRFELANGGTLFLDEIGEMPMETQVKLLRVLQTGEFERLGSGRPLRTDVRVIAATNRKLPEMIKAGLFRQDLFYRLNVFPITLPPLRDRPEDIPLLVWAFVKELSDRMGKAFERVPKKDLDALRCYDWPGNVRELRNVVERSMILAEGPELRLILPDGQGNNDTRGSRRLVDIQRQHVLEVLQSTQNRIHGDGGAADVLGLKPSTLYSLMARLGIPRRR